MSGTPVRPCAQRRVVVTVPEYWPRLHRVAIALYADEVILADSLQYSRQSYQNRARLRTADGWHWISVPLRGGQHGRPIRIVELAADSDWRGMHRRSLQHHYGTTPFFEHYAPDIFTLLDRPWERLGPLTCATTEWTLRAFGLRVPTERTGDLNPPVRSVADLSVHICGAEGLLPAASTWPPADLFAHAARVAYRETARHQNFGGFVPGMSALDALFNYGPEARQIVTRDAVLHRD